MSKFLNALYRLCFACVIFFACNKNDVSAPSHEVTYKIIADDYKLFSDVVYAVNGDSLIRGSAMDSTTSWVEHVKTSKTPFHAKIVASVINRGNENFNYTVQIFVDNKKVAEQTKTTLANTPSNAYAEYTIE